MKTTIYTLLLALFFSSSTFAQGGMYMKNRKEIMKKKIEFITSELQLTEKEKKEFIPIFKEYNSKKESLFMKKKQKMHYFYKNSLNMTEEELINLTDFLVDTDIQIAQLGKKYNEKFKKILPPLKIVYLHKAEQQFKRKLFKQMKKNGKGQKMHP